MVTSPLPERDLFIATTTFQCSQLRIDGRSGLISFFHQTAILSDDLYAKHRYAYQAIIHSRQFYFFTITCPIDFASELTNNARNLYARPTCQSNDHYSGTLSMLHDNLLARLGDFFTNSQIRGLDDCLKDYQERTDTFAPI